ncbi:MAG: hypothetical protein A2287_01225 [Candidatus Melainabacteria bacterium RIFOXYA12_FULL_32_12]|nr:MAG: hypothetical protein A2287_01225 [Candidatus Melainabacteria bacterium RIFOXYA12_FULL_32_12]
MLNKIYLRGFTLAEMLVTLTIVGIVAALTIPAIIQDVQTAQYKAAFKKAYADLDQATRRILIDYGGNIGGICSNNLCIRDKYLEYLNYSKKCDNVWNCFVKASNDGGEWEDLDGSPPTVGADASAILNNV